MSTSSPLPTPSAQALPPTRAGGHLTTARLCEVAGVTRGMLRLYEREGLLPLPRRSAAGYRHYPIDAADRVQAIRLLKDVGFTLRDIAALLRERDGGAMHPSRMVELAGTQLAQLDERIAQLVMVRECVAAVANGQAGSFDDPSCQFLVDFLIGPAQAGSSNGVS